MTPELAVRSRLLGTAAVSALLGTRIYAPDDLPQAPTLPALVYQRISDTSDLANDGTTGPRHPRIQLDAYARTQLDVEAVQEAVLDALHGQGWTLTDGSVVMLVSYGGSRDLPPDFDANPEPGVRLKRRSADYFVHFREA